MVTIVFKFLLDYPFIIVNYCLACSFGSLLYMLELLYVLFKIKIYMNAELLYGKIFSLDEESDVKFRLKRHDREDAFGFFTQFLLEMFIDDSEFSYVIAYIRVMKAGQFPGELPTAEETTISFISSVWSAERLFLLLSPMQRLKLEETISISYDCKDIENEAVFEYSILRGRNKTKKNFIKEQERIKHLMRSKIDLSSILLQNKDQLNMLLYDVNVDHSNCSHRDRS